MKNALYRSQPILLATLMVAMWLVRPSSRALAETVALPEVSEETVSQSSPRRRKNQKTDIKSVPQKGVLGMTTASGSSEADPAFTALRARDTESGQSAALRLKTNVRRLFKSTFQSKEDVQLLIQNAYDEKFDVSVIKGNAEQENITVTQEKIDDQIVATITADEELTPGEYTVRVADEAGDVISEEEFAWGVLALNTNKATYQPHEEASIAMAVLDEEGKMVCDADIKLKITNQESRVEQVLTTDNGDIIVNPECAVKGVTEKPDYEAAYTVGGNGFYRMELTAVTENGTHTVDDSFAVDDTILYDIGRYSATRIYPAEKYPVEITVTAREDFSGYVSEQVPANFTIMPSERSDVHEYQVVARRHTDVLGASDVQLEMPFEGDYEITGLFGGQLHDPSLRDKYHEHGVNGHDGIDWVMPEGTDVLAVDDGTVVLAAENHDYGTTVVIEHEWGKSYYGHLSEFTVPAGTAVERGHVVARSGSTGLSTAPHLHFGIKLNDHDVNNGFYGKTDPTELLGLKTDVSEMVLGVATTAKETNEIVWRVDLKKGETVTLAYEYDAPNVSPELYQIGPVSLYRAEENGSLESAKKIFSEGRPWQIAVDDFPEVASLTQSSFAASSSSHAINMPATVESGDLLLLLLTTDGNAAVTDPDGAGGWTEVATNTRSTFVRGSVWAKVADGTEDGLTVNFQTGGAETAAAHLYRVLAADWHGEISGGVEVAMSSVTTDTQDAPSLSPSWGSDDTLWFAYLAKSSTTAVTGYPTDYTNGVTTTTADSTSGSTVASARRELATATEDPGSFTAGGSTFTMTLAVRPQSVFPPSITASDVPFDHEKTQDTSPSFEFIGTDVDSDDLTYQIQVDDDTGFAAGQNVSYGPYTFDADNDADESAWTFVSTSGTNGLNPSNTGRAWSHEVDETVSTGVGPTSGQGGNPDGYVYTESSIPAAAGDTFVMTYNTVLDARATAWEVEFYTNQRGNDNDATAELQTNENGAGWVTQATFGGPSDPDKVASNGTQVWSQRTVDLAGDISGDETEVRILVTLGTTGNIFDNDYGIDTITVTGTSISSGPLINCESDTTCATGDGSFANTESGGDTDPFTSGERIRFTPTTTLSDDTTYYWRVRAQDPSDTAEYGEWSSVRSFTVDDSVDPSEWFQTTEEQLSTDTFTNSEANNSGQVELLDTISTTLNSESFEDPDLANDSALTNGDSTWDNQTGDDCDWLTSTDGATPSSGTGHDTDGAYDGNNAIYIEASAGAACLSGAFTALLQYDSTVNASSYDSVVVNFAYHMFGAQQGTLHLDVNDGGGWVSRWSASGNQGDIWNTQSVDLSQWYTSGTLSLRFRIVHSGASFAGDTVLDNITVQGVDAVTTGTVMSTPIDFDSVTADTWGTVSWTEDETNGSLAVSLYYNDGADCDTLIPNAALSGNESGFASGPIDISGLDTTTYNRICLLATLTNSGGTPYLNDWTVTWAEEAGGTAGSEGPLSPGTTANNTGYGSKEWADAGNIASSDDSYAAYQNTATPSNYLIATNFGFDIPDGATITGIEVGIERHGEHAFYGSSVVIRDDSLRLLKGEMITGDDNAATAVDWPANTDAYAMYGGEADLWGTAWTPSDINSSAFGVALAATSAGFFSTAYGYVDYIQMTVYYTTAGVSGPEMSQVMRHGAWFSEGAIQAFTF